MFKKNTAINIPFALVNATTGAALTGATVTARRSLDGAAQATTTGAVTELGNGQYVLAAAAGDMNGDTVGLLFTATNAIPVGFTIRTATKLVGELVDAAAITVPANFAALGITAGGKISGVVLTDTLTTYTSNTPQTGDAFARIGATGSGLTSLASAANLATLTGYVDTEVAAILAAVDTEVASILSTVTALSTTVGVAGAGLTGVGLAAGAITSASIAAGAITSAKFSVSAPAAGLASGILEKIDQLWRRFFKKAVKNATQILTYADDLTTVYTTQTIADDGTTQTQGAAS